jgi:Tfp pilus assembly protein FimT
LQDFLVRTQRQQVTSEIVSSLALARSEAIKRATPVTLASKNAGPQALQGGWRIFVDPNRTGTFDPAVGSATTLIADQNAYPDDQVKIGRLGSSQQFASGAEYLQFDSLVCISTLSGSNGSYAITVTVQRSGVDKAKSALCVGWAGRVRTILDKANNDTGACG